jgi:Thioredoxin-related protein
MKLVALILFSLFTVSSSKWLTDLDEAKMEASKSHKMILLTFSGSDWCVPCIRLHKEVFESSVFEKYADDNLVLVNADFPRLKKNRLTKEQTSKNEHLADQYNHNGTFPLTLLLNVQGKVIKQWEGVPKETPEEFINDIDASAHAVASVNN